MTIEHAEWQAGQAIAAGTFDEALELLRPLAERQSEYALMTLGWIYETGATGCVDLAAARALYEQAAAQGSGDGYCRLGWLLSDLGEQAAARAAFDTGARLGDDGCVSALAVLADHAAEHQAADAFEDRDYVRAAGLLRPLAERGSEYALLGLGWIHEMGAAGTADKQAAEGFYRRAVDRGSARGHLELGRLLHQQGKDQCARALFAAGAELGNIACMTRLGKMMIAGSGGDADPVRGREWLERAAAQGQLFAKRELLGLDVRQARSLAAKLAATLKVWAFCWKAGLEMAMDPGSDKVR